VPSERTFQRVLAALDGAALDTATCGYAADVVRGDAPAPVVGVCDDEPVGQVFLVAAVTHDSGAVLGQRQVPDKRGENAVIADLLTPLDVAGMMLTLDALHTTKKTARLMTGPLNPARRCLRRHPVPRRVPCQN
jgi:hypothetical protein